MTEEGLHEAIMVLLDENERLRQVLKEVIPFIGYEGDGALEAANKARAAINKGA